MNKTARTLSSFAAQSIVPTLFLVAGIGLIYLGLVGPGLSTGVWRGLQLEMAVLLIGIGLFWVGVLVSDAVSLRSFLLGVMSLILILAIAAPIACSLKEQAEEKRLGQLRDEEQTRYARRRQADARARDTIARVLDGSLPSRLGTAACYQGPLLFRCVKPCQADLDITDDLTTEDAESVASILVVQFLDATTRTYTIGERRSALLDTSGREPKVERPVGETTTVSTHGLRAWIVDLESQAIVYRTELPAPEFPSSVEYVTVAGFDPAIHMCPKDAFRRWLEAIPVCSLPDNASR